MATVKNLKTTNCSESKMISFSAASIVLHFRSKPNDKKFMRTKKIAVIGLGYVGLPLAVEFGRNQKVVGFDVNSKRVDELKNMFDSTRETTKEDLICAKHLEYTCNVNDLTDCNVYIVTVPTPIDQHKQPDFSPLLKASEMIGGVLKSGDLVIYESTVFPGCTEEICVPVLERVSGLKLNINFSCGYSPERINPGDREHRLTKVKKITSGSNPLAAEEVDDLYRNIIPAGTHKAESIKVAEAAKVIENTQRDINIALINEFAIIFNRLNIDTESVLLAAGSKWNFLPFRPGLVGGHCISVDPYYLTYKAQSIGYHPEIILAGRRLNDRMGEYVASQLVKAMTKRRIQVDGARVLIMGLAFKENCPDIRNTRVVDMVSEIKQYNCIVDVIDPWVSTVEAQSEYGINLVSKPSIGAYDAIVVAVAHTEFKEMGAVYIRALGKTNSVIYDVKNIFSRLETDLRL